MAITEIYSNKNAIRVCGNNTYYKKFFIADSIADVDMMNTHGKGFLRHPAGTAVLCAENSTVYVLTRDDNPYGEVNDEENAEFIPMRGGNISDIILNVTVSYDSATESYTADKTFAQMVAAIKAGKLVQVKLPYTSNKYYTGFINEYKTDASGELNRLIAGGCSSSFDEEPDEISLGWASATFFRAGDIEIVHNQNITGHLEDLHTENKDTFASAINEVYSLAKPAVITQTAPTAITLADNTEYYLTDVSDLSITYPSGRFESWIRLTTATAGTITITLPTSQYIGDEPTFGNSETWEISVKDGVVVAQKVGA